MSKLCISLGVILSLSVVAAAESPPMGDAPNAPYVVKHPKPPTDSVTRGPVMEITRGGQYKYDGDVLSEAKLVESLKSRLSKIDPDGVTIKLYSETPTAALLRTLKMNNISIKQIKVIR